MPSSNAASSSAAGRIDARTAEDDLGERRGAQLERLRGLGERSQELSNPNPARERLPGVAGRDPLGGAAVPACGFERLSRGFPVLREQNRVLVQPAGVNLRQRPRHPGVDTRPALAKLRGVGDLLRERMLERVLGLGIERRLVNELALAERADCGVELARVELHHASQQRLRELAADHRRRLQHGLRGVGEAVDARREHDLHARRQLERGARPREAVRAVRAREGARLDQGLDDLLREERVPLGARVDALGEPGERGVGAEQARQHLEQRRLRQRRRARAAGSRSAASTRRRTRDGSSRAGESDCPPPRPRGSRRSPRSPGRPSAGPRTGSRRARFVRARSSGASRAPAGESGAPGQAGASRASAHPERRGSRRAAAAKRRVTRRARRRARRSSRAPRARCP